MNRHMKRAMLKLSKKINRIKLRGLPNLVKESTIFAIEGNNIVGYYLDKAGTNGGYWRNAVWRKYIAEENITEAMKSAFYWLWDKTMTPIEESEWVQPFYAKVNRKNISTDKPEITDFIPSNLIGNNIYPTQRQTSHMLVYANKLAKFRDLLGKEILNVKKDEIKLFNDIISGINNANPKSVEEVNNLHIKFDCPLKYADMIAEQVKKAKAHFVNELTARAQKKAELEKAIAKLQAELDSIPLS